MLIVNGLRGVKKMLMDKILWLKSQNYQGVYRAIPNYIFSIRYGRLQINGKDMPCKQQTLEHWSCYSIIR